MDVGGREMADLGLQLASEKTMVSAASDETQAKTTGRKPVDRLDVERLCVGLPLYCPQVVPESAVHSAMTAYAVVVGVNGGGLRASRGSKTPLVE
jgi:hypothetical protein